MKNNLKIINPNLLIFLFLIFVISMIYVYFSFDYTYKKLKGAIFIFYFLPGLLFFTVTSIYNFIKLKKYNFQTKIIAVIPLFTIVISITAFIIYFFYILIFS